MMGLTIRALAALYATLIAIAALLFWPAGTLDYGAAWAFLIAFGVYGSAITIYLLKNDPALLERRVHGGPTAEKATGQRIAVTFASLAFLAIVVVSALDHRAHPFAVPYSLEVFGEALVALGMLMVFFVFRENPYSSATIELAAEQRVISTGPYGVVRHPMYSGSLVYLLGMPLALGSWWGLLAVIAMMAPLVWRLFDEEAFLAKSLPGYAEYQARVKYRLVPFIW